jgi:ribonuclease BN (tRNA processing enzyme)
MNIKLLGVHSCESKDTRLTTLLIDDILVVDAGGLTSSLSFPAQQKLKAILLTHQHYDHIRDVPPIVFNFANWPLEIDIYSTALVYETLTTHLLNGKVYPELLGWPPEKPRIRFTVIRPYEPRQVAGYSVLAVPVNHSLGAVGYEITSPEGKVVFYTGDTGPGLAGCWQRVTPQLLIIEVSAPDRLKEFYQGRGHLTPGLLKQELASFRALKGYLPDVVIVHMTPELEAEIKAELAGVARDLSHPIIAGYEGMELHL